MANVEYSVEPDLCWAIVASQTDSKFTGNFRLVASNRERESIELSTSCSKSSEVSGATTLNQSHHVRTCIFKHC